ncbi:UBC-like protein [Mollisia scopiformis]|uniref:UBC-like protein n=1 Tax=Mollisia scopiformis TaxID=149040 RepID=A0A194XRR2_MOLSC|nr:UBC-like protein [Mollisia scopiformis]KUJ22883.1 UBC-like protein [Mollisia scopiformis]
MSKPSKSSSSSSSSSRTPTKRILTELTAFNTTYPPTSPHPSIHSLLPTPSNLLSLNCILQPTHLPPSTGYSTGRFLLSISIPPTYPNNPPTITFLTKICHPNIAWATGEICLDVLKENWTPVLGVVGALESVVRLLAEPGVDSPLNVEMGALLRQGDVVGARGLVGYWCAEERFEGALEGGVGG